MSNSASTRRRRRSARSISASRISSRRSSRWRYPPARGRSCPASAFPIGIEARYYYGAPGGDLAVEAEATIAFNDAPFPSEPGFQFGLQSEEFAGTRQDVEAAATDSDGKSTVSLILPDLPDLTRPLAATMRVSVVEPSGRTVTETVTRPIRQRPLAIGLRSPNGDEAVPEGQAASIEIIARRS